MDSFDSYASNGSDHENHEGSFERTDKKPKIENGAISLFEKKLLKLQTDVKLLKNSANDSKLSIPPINLNFSNSKEPPKTSNQMTEAISKSLMPFQDKIPLKAQPSDKCNKCDKTISLLKKEIEVLKSQNSVKDASIKKLKQELESEKATKEEYTIKLEEEIKILSAQLNKLLLSSSS